MEKYVASFTEQLKEALNIGKTAQLSPNKKTFRNVVITGLGGSGIGGKIVSQLIVKEARLPIYINNNYVLPNFVDEHTLVLVSSYSGNTEETLEAMKMALNKNAEVAAITSGGEVEVLAKANQLNYISIPGGHPPRTALAYSLTQQFFLLNHYGICGNGFINELASAIELLNAESDTIKSKAKSVAEKVYQKQIAIYSEVMFEGVATRLRQQLNENAKVLCWHHVLPEMNHNELVGWAGGNDSIVVLFLRNQSDFLRTKVRMDLSKEIIAKQTPHVIEIWSKGNNPVQESLYHIHLGDWVSVYLAELNEVDPIEVDVITHLKSELAKV